MLSSVHFFPACVFPCFASCLPFVTLSKVFEVCRSTGLIRLSWVNSCSLHEVTASIFLWSWNELSLKTLLLTLLRSDGLRACVSSLHWLGGDVNKVSIKKGPQECFTHAQMVSLLINLYRVSTRAFDVFVSLLSSSSTRRPLQKRSMKSQYLASKKLFRPRLLLVELLVWTFRWTGNILSRSDLVSDGLTILSEVLSSNPSGASTCDVLNPNLFPNGITHKQKLVWAWTRALFQTVFSGLY